MRRELTALPKAQVAASKVSFRHFTNVVQFNPIHDFSSRGNIPHAADEKQFRAMIVNPGPLRITYSPDYLDWYHKAYNSRIRYEKERGIREQKFNGSTITGAQSNTAGLAGRSIRPLSSLRRSSGESQKSKAQKMITEASVQHGLFDVFERLPQFPNIHIDKCSDDHIIAIYNEMILPTAVTSEEVWEKALMYRALLIERAKGYPNSFKYILEVADSVALVSTKDSSQDTVTALPDKSAADYFVYLVKKYHIENGNEADVVLQCHRHPEGEKLLFCNPPPSEKAETHKVPVPEDYPSLERITDENNINLLRCLIFGEFNTMVSADPFVKYPEASSFVLRPRSEDTLLSKSNANTAIAVAVSGRRGSLLAPLTNNVETGIDGRGRDVLRSQQNHSNADSFFNKEFARRLEADPALYASDRTQYNPRAIRAESRDYTTRRLLKVLRVYDAAESGLVHRASSDAYAAERVSGQSLGISGNNVLPTVAHFTNLLLSDKHIAFCVVALEVEKANAIRQCVVDTAEILYEIAREYHIESQRLLLSQKLKMAASLLDYEVGEALASLSEDSICMAMVKQLGSYISVSSRRLNELGQTTTARGADFNRWRRQFEKISTQSL